MTTELTTTTGAIVLGYSLAEAGQAANTVASKNIFARELAEASENTRISYRSDLVTWADYLAAAGVDLAGCDFYNDPDCWQGVTYGLVEGFKQWMLKQGFAIASVNRKLSCVRRFCKMAGLVQIGEIEVIENGQKKKKPVYVIATDELALIQTVRTIKRGKGMEIDEKRPQTRIDSVVLKQGQYKGSVRTKSQKATAVLLSDEQVKQLKQQGDSPQGRRDTLLMCLLLDHGLRAGEVVALTAADFNLKTGKMKFWREKVKKEQTHKLTADTLRALRAYLPDAPAMGPILRASRKGGELVDVGGMTTVSISDRVRTLGAAIGVSGLSAHDCRHTWATHAIAQGTDAFALKEAGGWSAIATVSRYVEAAKIANEGVKLAY